MLIKRNIFITNTGEVRMTKQEKGTNLNELAVELFIDVPDLFFKRPMPIVKLSIPEEYLLNPEAEVIAEWIAPEVAQSLKVGVESVRDGLVEMVRRQEEERKCPE